MSGPRRSDCNSNIAGNRRLFINRTGHQQRKRIDIGSKDVRTAAAGQRKQGDVPPMSDKHPIAHALPDSPVPTKAIDAVDLQPALSASNGWDFKAFAVFLRATDLAWVMNPSNRAL